MSARALRLAARAASALAAGLVVACGGAAPIEDATLAVRVETSADRVVLGRSFPLTVTRVWRADLEPTAWDDRSLAPLALRLLGTSRRDDGRHVEETRRYRAYAFALDPASSVREKSLSIRGVSTTVVPLEGGPERKATAEPIRLLVTRTLDPERPGAPEPPGSPPPRASVAPRLAIVLGAILALVAFVLIRRRRRRSTPRDAMPADSPPLTGASPIEAHIVALDALRALEARETTGGEDVAADFVALSAIVRAYAATRFSLRAAEKTTEELLASAASSLMGEGPRRRLATVLVACDLVKFAAFQPTRADRAQSIESARSFVTETAAPAEAAGAPTLGSVSS